MSSGVIIQAFTLPKSGSIGGRGGISRLFHGISPRAVAASASACRSRALPPAVPMPSASRARDEHRGDRLAEREAGGDVAGRRLARQQRGLRCSLAFALISSTDVGKSSFSSSTVTPDSTASSDG